MEYFLSATSNTLRITGVQLEVGDAATDFEHLPFDVQLQRCERYYENGFDTGYYPAADVNYGNMAGTYQATCYAVDTLRCMIPFKTRKRGIPAVTTYRVDGLGDGSGDSARWDMYDAGQGNWQQMDGTTSTGEATEYGVDLNFVDTNFELQESFIILGGWEADAEL